jgi:hypothetical protein
MVGERKPDVTVVLGSWSGGTSACAAVVAALGADPRPPVFRIDDPATPFSGESQALRRLVLGHFSEPRMRRTHDAARLPEALRAWAGPGPAVAKYPPLAWFVPEMVEAWEARFLIVRRPLDRIEATRIRRRWPPVYGAVGARLVYDRIARSLPADAPRLDVDFADLRRERGAGVARIAGFLGLAVTPEAGEALRPPAPPGWTAPR